MHEGTREAVGFLCRWLLLAVVWVMGLAAGWVALVAAESVLLDPQATLVFSDAVWGPVGSQRMFLNGHVSVSFPGSASFVLCSVPVAGASRAAPDEGLKAPGPRAPRESLEAARPRRQRQLLGIVRAGRCGVPFKAVPAGFYEVTVKGVPYGPAAFCFQRLWLCVVPRDRRVLLFDARLAARMSPPQRATGSAAEASAFRRMVLQLAGAGFVALFDYGGPQDLRSRHGVLRRSFPRLALVSLMDEQRPATAVLWNLAARLNRPAAERMEVVTGNPELARRLAKTRFAVHLLLPPGSAGEAASGDGAEFAGVRRYPSLAKLKDSLARTPIP
jgi:hypothetical protein